MHKVIDISLTGHPEPFRLHEEAVDVLRDYLDRARAGITHELDADEVIGDLERSIGEKLVARRQGERAVLDLAAVRAVIEEIGTVGGDEAEIVPRAGADPSRVRRRLYRIQEGQEWAGVCTGLAAYAQVNVDTVRWIFVLLGLLTAGIFILVYIVAMFVLPVVPTREAFAQAQVAPDPTP